MRFIAIASVSCASREIEPSDIAPVEKRFTISLAGSTSSSGMPPSAASRKRSSPRSVERRDESALTVAGVRLVRLVRARAHRVLEQRDRVRVPLVVLAVAPPGVEARSPAAAVVAVPGYARAWRASVSRGELSVADAADARGGAGEVAVDELGREADGLEDLRAAVRRDRRDAHLRDRLQQALGDALRRARPAPRRSSSRRRASRARRARRASRASDTG